MGLEPNNFPQRSILTGTEELYTQTDGVSEKFTLSQMEAYLRTNFTIDELTTLTLSLQAEIDTINTGLVSVFATYDAAISANESAIATNVTNIATNVTNIATNGAAITTLAQRVAGIETNLLDNTNLLEALGLNVMQFVDDAAATSAGLVAGDVYYNTTNNRLDTV